MNATNYKVFGHEMGDYDDSIRYPMTLPDFVAKQTKILKDDYVNPRKGWSDPCGEFCPECKDQCHGRDEDKHPSSLGLHCCGKHLWHINKERERITVKNYRDDGESIWS